MIDLLEVNEIGLSSKQNKNFNHKILIFFYIYIYIYGGVSENFARAKALKASSLKLIETMAMISGRSMVQLKWN